MLGYCGRTIVASTLPIDLLTAILFDWEYSVPIVLSWFNEFLWKLQHIYVCHFITYVSAVLNFSLYLLISSNDFLLLVFFYFKISFGVILSNVKYFQFLCVCE